MKYLSLVFVSVFVSFTTSAQAPKTKVLILGSYHMGNPGLDAFNMKADDVTSPKRQKEIEEFTELLATFKPTVICTEVKLDRQQKLNDQYQAYVTGKAELRKNELDQIAFRIGKKLRHPMLYAIDADAPFEMDTVIKTAQKYQFTKFLDLLQKMPGYMQEENKKLYASTITEFFQYINSDDYNRQSHGFYLDMAAIGKGANYVGADLAADWYKRNLRIYKNLLSLDLKPDDRVLILFGAGHAKILQDLVEDSSGLELVKLSQLGK